MLLSILIFLNSVEIVIAKEEKKMKGWMGEWKREGWLLLSNSGNGESSIGGVGMNEVI